MRIVVDVSPLSHPRTGIGNYIRGSLAGMAAAAGGEHELVAFAPTSLRGPAAIRGALGGIAVEQRLVPLPASHALRTAWSRLGRPAVERLAGRLDAFLFSEWMYPAQRSGVRATVFHDLVPLHHPEWCTARTVSMHTAKARHAAQTCHVVFANSQFTADDLEASLGIEPDRIVLARPGLEPGLGTGGAARRPRDRGGARSRDDRAAQEHRAARRGLAAARRRAGSRPRRRRGLGRSPRSRRPADPPARLRPRRGDPAALPRRGRATATRRSTRASGCRSWRRWPAGRPSSRRPTRRSTRPAATPRYASIPSSAEAIAAGLREAIARRDELVPLGLAHAARFSWERTGATMLAALAERA